MAKTYVIIPCIEERCSEDVLDCEYNNPKIKQGLFVTANSAKHAVEIAQKSLAYFKSTFVAMEYRPEVLVSFSDPQPILKEMTKQGEVLPL